MTLIKTETLTEEVKEFHELIMKKSAISMLRSLMKRPSIAAVRALVKMTNEHHQAIEEKNFDVTNNHDYFPSEKTQMKYVRMVRKLFDDVYTSFNKNSLDLKNSKIDQLTISNVPVDWIKPDNNDNDCVILHVHGGGYVVGSPEIYHAYAARLAAMTGVSVVLPDYRLAPEHPFPAGLEDCIDVYRGLLLSGYDPEKIILVGDSAGGGMVLAMILKMKAECIDLPGGVIPISPYADLTFSGESMIDKVSSDIVVADFPLHFFVKCYVDINNIPLNSPLVSPLFGDYQGFPQMLFVTSDSEMLLDDTIRIAEKAENAGVDVEVLLGKDMPHVYPCLATTLEWEEVDFAFVKMTQFILKTLHPREKQLLISE